MAIGLFVAIFSQKEYTAATTFVPQTTEGVEIGGGLGGLAAMAGINLGGMNGESGIPASLYPQIMGSIPFQKELLQTPLTIDGEKSKLTFSDYYTNIYTPSLLGYLKKYTLGLPSIIIKAIKGKPKVLTLKEDDRRTLLFSFTEHEKSLLDLLSKQVRIEINEKDGYVTIIGKMPEALASAQLTKRAQELLQSYIIKFKVQKSEEQLEFIRSRYLEKEKYFQKAQSELANFRDRNQNTKTAIAQTKLEVLQSEYNLAYGVYLELAKQLETQQIKVKENTPVFTILKPVTIPIEKSAPKRFLILFIWAVFGGFIGVFLVFSKGYFIDFKRIWNEKNTEVD